MTATFIPHYFVGLDRRPSSASKSGHPPWSELLATRVGQKYLEIIFVDAERKVCPPFSREWPYTVATGVSLTKVKCPVRP